MLLAESIAITGKPVHDHLDRAMDVPRVHFCTPQGDVLILRVPNDAQGVAVWEVKLADATPVEQREMAAFAATLRRTPHATTPMPPCVVAVASEAGAHTHTLHPNGPCQWDSRVATTTDLVLGVLTVPVGSTALLSHDQHGNFEIMPGTYQLRRQREMAGEWRMVAD